MWGPRRLIQGVGLIAVSLLLLLSSWIIWYRSRDHTEELLAGHSPLAGYSESSVSDSSGVREFSIRLEDRAGLVTTGRLRLPQKTEGPLPVILVLGGHGTGSQAAGLVHLDREAALCAIDYPPYPGEGRVRLVQAPLLIPQAQRAVRRAVRMSQTTLEYLCSREWADTTRITVLGASFGVPFAVIAALDPQVDGLVLVHGAADLERLVDWNLRGKIGSRLLRRFASRVLGIFLAPFEPAAYIGSVAPRPVLMVNSRDDEKIPEECSRLLFNAAGHPKELIWIESAHIHPSNRELIDRITAIIQDWMEENSLIGERPPGAAPS